MSHAVGYKPVQQWFPRCGTRRPSKWNARPFRCSTQKAYILFLLTGFC